MTDACQVETFREKVGLVVGIANEHSIAAGCAHSFDEAAASLAVTYLNDRVRPYADPVGRVVNAFLCLPPDVQIEGELKAVFNAVKRK